jgi:hypothetical protein
MKVGDIVMIKEDPRQGEEKEYGIIVSFEPRHPMHKGRDPDCDVWNDAIVLWPTHGLSWHMKAMLEVTID